MKSTVLGLVTFCCYLIAVYGQTSFVSIRKDAITQKGYAGVIIDTAIHELTNEKKEQAKTEDQLVCMIGIQNEAYAGAATILDQTLAKILPEIYKLAESGDQVKIEEFEKRTNYPQFKTAEWAEFRNRFKDWMEDVKEKMNTCFDQKK